MFVPVPAWAMAISSQRPNLHPNYSLVTHEMRSVSDLPVRGREPEGQLLAFWQGDQSVAQFACWRNMQTRSWCRDSAPVSWIFCVIVCLPYCWICLFSTTIIAGGAKGIDAAWAHSLDRMTMTDNTRPRYILMNGMKGTLWSSARTFSAPNYMRDFQRFISQLPPTASSHAGWKWGW